MIYNQQSFVVDLSSHRVTFIVLLLSYDLVIDTIRLPPRLETFFNQV